MGSPSVSNKVTYQGAMVLTGSNWMMLVFGTLKTTGYLIVYI
jgi:hypothetical protein